MPKVYGITHDEGIIVLCVAVGKVHFSVLFVLGL